MNKTPEILNKMCFESETKVFMMLPNLLRGSISGHTNNNSNKKISGDFRFIGFIVEKCMRESKVNHYSIVL